MPAGLQVCLGRGNSVTRRRARSTVLSLLHHRLPRLAATSFCTVRNHRLAGYASLRSPTTREWAEPLLQQVTDAACFRMDNLVGVLTNEILDGGEAGSLLARQDLPTVGTLFLGVFVTLLPKVGIQKIFTSFSTNVLCGDAAGAPAAAALHARQHPGPAVQV